jgi:hypothetical protein
LHAEECTFKPRVKIIISCTPISCLRRGTKQHGPRGENMEKFGISFSVTSKKKLGQEEKYYIVSS